MLLNLSHLNGHTAPRNRTPRDGPVPEEPVGPAARVLLLKEGEAGGKKMARCRCRREEGEEAGGKEEKFRL